MPDNGLGTVALTKFSLRSPGAFYWEVQMQTQDSRAVLTVVTASKCRENLLRLTAPFRAVVLDFHNAATLF